MKHKGKFGLKKRSRIDFKKILIGLGITAALCALATMLCGIVVSSNEDECKTMSLSGNLFGCVTDNKYVYDHIVLVVGNTANSPKPSVSKTVKRYLVNSTIEKSADVRIFSASSAHNTVKYHDEELDTSSEDIRVKAKNMDRKIELINEAISQSPKAGGVEYLDTIIRAGKKVINDQEKGEKSLLIVIGSGLSDGGILDFTKGDWDDIDADKTANRLAEKKQIIEDKLEGLSIYWSGIGSVANPQKPLSEKQNEKLQELYEAILDVLGAKVLGFEDVTSEDESVKTNYAVVTIETEVPDCALCEGNGADMSNQDVGFKENEAVLVDEAKAKESLDPLIKEMKRNSNEIVTITGYVSYIHKSCTSSSYDNQLAQRRAQTVKAILVNAGIDASRIIAQSGGKGERGGDECATGAYDIGKAAQNMYVNIKAEMK